jgi:hypothetical protein
MKLRSMHATIRLLAGFGLVIALAPRCLAQDAPAAAAPAESAPATQKIGPGAPPLAIEKPAAPAAPAKAKGKSKAAAPSGIHLSPVTPIGATVTVHPKVLEECQLQSILPKEIAERNSDVVLSDAAGGTRLELKIVDVHAPSGGVFSGPKWITVDGRLLQGKTVKGSFIAKETSMASATACGMLSKVMVVLAGDIAEWLHNPSKDAHLGHAH